MKITPALTRLAAMAMIVLVAALFAPSCSISTASLSDVKVCTSVSGGECGSDNATVPHSSAVIYCSAKVKNAPPGTKVTFTWSHGGQSLGSADVETSGGTVYSNLNTGGALEAGKYSVTVKLNSDNSQPVTKEFTLE